MLKKKLKNILRQNFFRRKYELLESSTHKNVCVVDSKILYIICAYQKFLFIYLKQKFHNAGLWNNVGIKILCGMYLI